MGATPPNPSEEAGPYPRRSLETALRGATQTMEAGDCDQGGLWVISLLPAGTKLPGRVPLTQALHHRGSSFSIFGKMIVGGILAVLAQARPPAHKGSWAWETVLQDSKISTACREQDKGPVRAVS